VHVRSLAPELTRVGYVIASLEPSEGAARALLDYANLYAGTTDGAVPFKQWPQALRGHFLCRIPGAVTPSHHSPRMKEPHE
jgi:predicted metal-binding protein